MIIFFNFLFPFEISFHLKFHNLKHSKIVMIFSFIFYVSKFLLNFNKCYYENGFLVKERKKIMENYLKYLLFYDIISFIPIIISSFEIESLKYAKLIYLIEYIQAKKIYRKFLI